MMKQQSNFSKCVFFVACLSSIIGGSMYGLHSSKMANSNYEMLLSENVDAFGDYSIWGWLSNITDPIGYYNQNTWIEQVLTCTITETKESDTYSIGVSAGLSLGFESGSSSTSCTYPGHYTSCEYDEDRGEVAHCNSTDCSRD